MKWILSPKKKLFLSISAGVIAASAAGVTFHRQEKRIRTHYTMTTVLQAKKYIAEGKTVTPDLVEEVSIPAAYLQPTALSRLADLKNQQGAHGFKARIGLLKGEQLSKSKLYEPTALRGLAWTLAPGQSALTLKLSLEAAVAGLIQPGDWVNFYCTVDKQPDWPKDRTHLLLPHVRVIAVEGRIWDPAAPLIAKNEEKGVRMESLLVTLALSPREAGLATLAADKGRVVLALASPLESQIRSVPAIELVDLR